MSTVNLERPFIEDRRPGRNQTRQVSNARARLWERVLLNTRLTATELANAMVRPRCKIYRDFSEELARAARWRSNRIS